jgi:GAF domain-containing protein
MMTTGDGSARRLLDFLTGEELHLLELYTFMYGPLSVEFQVSVELPMPEPSVVGIALNRADSNFTDEELKLLEALRPHLRRAYRTAQLLTERRQALESIADVLEEEGRALHVVGTPVSGGAAALVEEYFGEAPAGELPSALAVWLELKR